MESMKSKILLVLLFFTFSHQPKAQSVDYLRQGLLRAHLTLSPARSLSMNASHFYLHGALEGYLSSRLSLAGESYYYFGQLSPAVQVFEQNHSSFFGANYHWFTTK